MNNRRRAALKDASSMIDKAYEIVCSVMEEEQYSLDNIPENMQSGDRYEMMEEAVDNLSDAVDSLGAATDSISQASI